MREFSEEDYESLARFFLGGDGKSLSGDLNPALFIFFFKLMKLSQNCVEAFCCNDEFRQEIKSRGRKISKEMEGSYTLMACLPLVISLSFMHRVLRDAREGRFPDGPGVKQAAESLEIISSIYLKKAHAALVSGDSSRYHQIVTMLETAQRVSTIEICDQTAIAEAFAPLINACGLKLKKFHKKTERIRAVETLYLLGFGKLPPARRWLTLWEAGLKELPDGGKAQTTFEAKFQKMLSDHKIPLMVKLLEEITV